MTRKQQIKSIKYIYTLLDGLNKNDLSELTHQNIKFRKYFDKFYGEKVKNNLIREIENLATLRMNVRSFNSATEYTKYAVVALKHEALKDKIVIKTI